MNKLDKIRVGVFMGGKSVEREVSFNSGRTICDHIDSDKYKTIPIFQTEVGDLYLLPWYFLHRGKISDFRLRLKKEAKKIKWDDLKNHIDFAFIALHGRFGEDGTIQGFMQVLDIPYLGTKVFGSALGMNKSFHKKVLFNNGINVPKGIVLTPKEIESYFEKDIFKKLNDNKIFLENSVIIKPAHEGSSLGISVIKNKKELRRAIWDAYSCSEFVKQDVLIEEKLEGMEFVCVHLQKVDKSWFSFPLTEVIIENKDAFYDYEQKYMPGRASKITPARCSDKDAINIQEICLRATKLLNFSTISRIDGFLTKDKKVYLIDPNSLTGMSPATFLFHQAAEIGMSHTDLINYLIETELQNYGLLCQRNEKNMKDKLNIKKKRVVVLLGGDSNEKEISLESGRNVCYKLPPNKYEIIPVFINDEKKLFKLDQRLLIQNSTREISKLVTKDLQLKWNDLSQICDFVFIGLHGGIGEDGSVQGTLEMLGLPYNGSGVLTSALCMDKYKTNNLIRKNGFDVPWSLLIRKSDLEKNKTSFIKISFDKINYPCILKPHDDGCSVGVKKINNLSYVITSLQPDNTD